MTLNPLRRFMAAMFLALQAFGLVAAAPTAAFAFGACQAFSDRGEANVIPARFGGTVPNETLALTFIGHASFLIQSPGGAEVVTDYAGYHGQPTPPRAATMNNAHSTHFTYHPDPGIEHVLKGWPEEGETRAKHRVEVEDLKIRNVSTDVIDWDGSTRKNGNSIFIFELGDLCVAHLGHLHHVPTEAQFAAIGFLDVVMAPVDGGLTLSHADMTAVLKRLQAKLVLPMHYFGPATLQTFLTELGGAFEVELAKSSTVLVSKATLPKKPTLLVTPPLSSDVYDYD